MRSRTIREGSVGLLILGALAVGVGLVLWIRNIGLGQRGYRFTIQFPQVIGVQVGASVRYRGLDVGQVTEVIARTEGVDVTVEIENSDLLIPQNSDFTVNQSGFIGQTSVDIFPPQTISLSPQVQEINPRSSRCDDIEQIICHTERVQGEIGVSFISLLERTEELTEIYSDPEFFNSVSKLLNNAADAAASVEELTTELQQLSNTTQEEFQTLTSAVTQTSNQVGTAVNRFGNTAQQYSQTAEQLSQLIASVNQLVETSQNDIIQALSSISQTSNEIGQLVNSLKPVIEQADLEETLSNVEATLANVETITDNVAVISTDLREASATLTDPTVTTVLQQTLDSARVTFENVQKITSDLDEVTGDPAFRENLKNLVNGLGNLVSSTEQLEQQIELARELEAVNTALGEISDHESFSSQPDLDNQKQMLKLAPPAAKKIIAD